MATLTSNPPKNTFSQVLHSPQAMQEWGKRLARLLKPGDVIALIGELGSGKTTLVQGIAAGWGYVRRANSPTFALVNEYPSKRGPLLHMDMYRLSENELEAFPLEDYIDPHTTCLIEWADRIQSRWPAGTLTIHLTTLGPETRQLDVTAPTPTWNKRLASLRK